MFRAIVPIILIIASGFIGFFYIRPLYEDVAVARDERQGIDDALQKTKEIGDRAEELRNKVESISVGNLDKLEVILPKDIDEIRFLNMLNSIAQRHSLSLEGLTATSDTDGESKGSLEEGQADDFAQTNVLDISFSTVATYEAFQVFLNDLEQSLSLIDVDSLELSVSEPSGEEEQAVQDLYTYSISLSTYWIE